MCKTPVGDTAAQDAKRAFKKVGQNLYRQHRRAITMRCSKGAASNFAAASRPLIGHWLAADWLIFGGGSAR